MCWGGLGGGSACKRLDDPPAMVNVSIPATLQMATLDSGGECARSKRTVFKSTSSGDCSQLADALEIQLHAPFAIAAKYLSVNFHAGNELDSPLLVEV